MSIFLKMIHGFKNALAYKIDSQKEEKQVADHRKEKQHNRRHLSLLMRSQFERVDLESIEKNIFYE